MDKVVIDTNVLISAMISKSFPYQIIHDLVFESKVTSFTSDPILAELAAVVDYPKFQNIPGFADSSRKVLASFSRFSIVVQPIVNIEILKDKSDNKFLDVAVSTRANFIITGNNKHFPFKTFEGTEIISPREYCDRNWRA